MNYRVGIVGCGKVGGFLDSPTDTRIITHAHAYFVSKRFKITSCCDLNPKAVENFRSRWGKNIKGYLEFDEFLNSEYLDVISICTDTNSHGDLLVKSLAKEGLRVIVCEKPFVANMEEFKSLGRAIKAHPEKCIVINYPRRYDPSFRIVEAIIKNRRLGKPINFFATFNKGFYHNGCHLLELIIRLFGEIRSISVLDNKEINGDHYGNFFIDCDFCSGEIFNSINTKYSIFEMSIYLERGKIEISESGHKIEIFKTKNSLRYPGYYELHLYRRLNDTLIFRTLHLINYVYKLLKSNCFSNDLFKEHLRLNKNLLEIKRDLFLDREILYLSENKK